GARGAGGVLRAGAGREALAREKAADGQGRRHRAGRLLAARGLVRPVRRAYRLPDAPPRGAGARQPRPLRLRYGGALRGKRLRPARGPQGRLRPGREVGASGGRGGGLGRGARNRDLRGRPRRALRLPGRRRGNERAQGGVARGAREPVLGLRAGRHPLLGRAVAGFL
ncbi:MAG: hypothetical protein AVDCRST_MAG05-2458, partial [uncultured Rubrobacteraceae bacterium]